MAETNSPRFGILVWGADTDGPTRTEFNGSFNKVETLAAIDKQGSFASRPSAGIQGTYYWDTDNKFLWRDNGAGWNLAGQNTQDAYIRSSAVGNVPLTVDAIASQTADLLQLKVNGTTQWSVNKTGDLTGGVITGKSAVFTNATAASVVLALKAAASQSAAVISAQNNAGSNLLSLSPVGEITTPLLATTSQNTTVVNASTGANVSNMAYWNGTPALDVEMLSPSSFNDFLYLHHAATVGAATSRRIGLVMKVGSEDLTGAAQSAAMYLYSNAALFATPTFRIDVRDQLMWEMDPVNGSVTAKNIYANGANIKSLPNGTAAFFASNTQIGTQNSGNDQYFRAATTSNGFYWYNGGSHSNTVGDPGSGGQLLQSLTADGVTGLMTTGRILITRTDDISPTATTPPLQIGPSNDINMIFDVNEIQTRNNGVADTLILMGDAGRVQLGRTLDTRVEINGRAFSISVGGTEPSSPTTNDIWLDGRVNQGLKVRTSGGSWSKINP